MGLIDNTPMGKLIMHVVLAFAEFERDMIVERTQAGKAIARQKPGYHKGRISKYGLKEKKQLKMVPHGKNSECRGAFGIGSKRTMKIAELF